MPGFIPCCSLCCADLRMRLAHASMRVCTMNERTAPSTGPESTRTLGSARVCAIRYYGYGLQCHAVAAAVLGASRADPASTSAPAETINALQAFRKRNSDAKAALQQIKEQRTEVDYRCASLFSSPCCHSADWLPPMPGLVPTPCCTQRNCIAGRLCSLQEAHQESGGLV